MKLFIDTNILYLFLRPPTDMVILQQWLADQRDRFANEHDEAVISPMILDELAYRLLLAVLKDESDKNPLKTLRKDPEGTLRLHAQTVAGWVESVTTLPGLIMAPVTKQSIDLALRYMVRFALLPRDSCHLAVAESEQCDGILSLDPDFQRAEEVMLLVGPPENYRRG